MSSECILQNSGSDFISPASNLLRRGGDYQCGFRNGRSTTDQLFIIRQIMEKAWEHNISIHHLFVDFKQAYDSIIRNVLFGIMEEFGIPSKLIRLTKASKQTSKQLAAFADNADLIGRGTLAVKESFVEMQTTAKEVGLL